MNIYTKPKYTQRAPLLASKISKGFTLIEVLVALIVVSIGMLGIAGLYVQSLQAGSTAQFRHHAIILAGDVADRIRANPGAEVLYEGAGANNNCVNGGVNCDEAEMAANDIFLWQQQAAATLPNGNVNIIFDAAAVPPTYEIEVEWTQPEGNLNYTVEISVLEL